MNCIWPTACHGCPYVDIRNLSIHELYLANSLSWVLARNAENDPLNKVPSNNAVPLTPAVVKVIDAGSVEATKKAIIESTWYKQACHDPKLVADILSGITTVVVNDSINRSSDFFVMNN